MKYFTLIMTVLIFTFPIYSMSNENDLSESDKLKQEMRKFHKKQFEGSRFPTPDSTKIDYSPEILLSLAKKGSASAQYDLGLKLYSGDRIERDELAAIRWWEKSAMQDYSMAQLKLGELYLDGYEVNKNIETAKSWFNKACKNGSEKGCVLYNYLKNR